MKKYFVNIVAVISLVLLFICRVEIKKLREEVQNLQNQVVNEISSMESNMMYNISQMEEILEKEASILAKSSWNYGEFDKENHKIEVKCSVTPKEYDPEKTKAVITYDGNEVPMELQNGAYVEDGADWESGEAVIYDKNGKELYRGNW